MTHLVAAYGSELNYRKMLIFGGVAVLVLLLIARILIGRL
jgi:hypothetical protein